MAEASITIKANTENEVLAKIEQVNDTATKNALLALFFWRLATQAVVQKSTAST